MLIWSGYILKYFPVFHTCTSKVYTDFTSDIMKSMTHEYKFKLVALAECRPIWPRQIITPILPNVKVLNLGSYTSIQLKVAKVPQPCLYLMSPYLVWMSIYKYI